MTPPSSSAPIGREMTKSERIVFRLRWCRTWLRRRFPYLVWYGDEIDVRITLSEDKLNENDPFRALFGGAFFEIERTFHEMGISFDTGMGCEGRDWEWDWSLSGPISVSFRRRTQRPERRTARPKPTLVETP